MRGDRQMLQTADRASDATDSWAWILVFLSFAEGVSMFLCSKGNTHLWRPLDPPKVQLPFNQNHQSNGDSAPEKKGNWKLKNY